MMDHAQPLANDPYDLVFHCPKDDGSLDTAVRILGRALSSGYSIMEDGSVVGGKAVVDRVKGLKIEVRPRDHQPPHFHVSCAEFSVSFDLYSCEILKGSLRGRERRIIRAWHDRFRDRVVAAWTDTRPG